VSFPLSIITDLELYTTSSCLIALYFSHYAAKVPEEGPTGKEIITKKNAVIWNSIAITVNLMGLSIFFIFIPITLASDGKMTFDYFLTFKTIAFLLSTTAILGHFFFVKFAMIEDDAMRITLTLAVWAGFNLFFEDQNGIFFSELIGSKNIIKMSLSIFVIFATTCFYLILCPISQRIKGLDEKKLRRVIIKEFKKAAAANGENSYSMTLHTENF